MNRLRFLTLLFLIAAGLAAVAAVSSDAEAWVALRREAARFPWRFHPGWLALAMAAAVGALLATGTIWAFLYRGAGGRIGAAEGSAAWLGSNLGRYLPGKVWQLTGLAAYLKGRGDSGAAGLATSLALQAVVLATGAALALGCLGSAAFAAATPWTLVIAVPLILAALHPRILEFLIRTGARLLGEEEPEARIGVRTLLWSALGALLVWMAYGLGLWALVRGLAPSAAIGPVFATGAFAAAYVIGYLVLVAPGGLVVREGALAALLGGVGAIPLGAAGAIALAARVWTTAAELLAFAIASLIGLRAARAGR